MAKKITDLPTANTFTGVESVLLTQDNKTVQGSVSAILDHGLSYIAATSGDWDSSYTTVGTNSASWDDHADISLLQTTSGDWDSSYTTVNTNSASWDAHTDPYDDTLLQTTSGDWDSTYNTVESNSASWDAHTDPYDDTLLQSSSSNWDSSYTTVNTNSASWVGGGGGGSSIVASYVDNAFAINKPTSADVIVPVTGLSYEMQSGKTYYIRVFVLSTTSFGSDEEFIYLSHTPWAATGGVKEGLVGKHWSDLGLGASNGGLHSGMTQYSGSWYEPTASSHQTAYWWTTYAGFSEIEGFITAPSTATFTPTISYLGTPTGSMNVRVQGVIMEMP